MAERQGHLWPQRSRSFVRLAHTPASGGEHTNEMLTARKPPEARLALRPIAKRRRGSKTCMEASVTIGNGMKGRLAQHEHINTQPSSG